MDEIAKVRESGNICETNVKELSQALIKKLGSLGILQETEFDSSQITINNELSVNGVYNESTDSIEIKSEFSSNPYLLLHELVHAFSARYRYKNQHAIALKKTGFSTEDKRGTPVFVALNEGITDSICKEILNEIASDVTSPVQKKVTEILSDDFFSYDYSKNMQLVHVFISKIAEKRKLENHLDKVKRELQKHYFTGNLIGLKRMCLELSNGEEIYRNLRDLNQGKYFTWSDDDDPIEDMIDIIKKG